MHEKERNNFSSEMPLPLRQALLYCDYLLPVPVLEENNITTRADFAHGAVIDNAFTTSGVVTARDNTVTTWGENADGILMDSWYSAGNSFEATGNFLTAEGDGPFGYGVRYVDTGAIDGIINDTSSSNTFGFTIYAFSIDSSIIYQVFVDPETD